MWQILGLSLRFGRQLAVDAGKVVVAVECPQSATGDKGRVGDRQGDFCVSDREALGNPSLNREAQPAFGDAFAFAVLVAVVCRYIVVFRVIHATLTTTRGGSVGYRAIEIQGNTARGFQIVGYPKRIIRVRNAR